ncbi:acyl carrier protein [Amycolatopsis sp. cg5]|uniref:acyl carrier protein n=1 Tax=Amycolatopsis sp. cg5 TaxID=3238802 RepID=UPI0035268097
MTEFTQEDLFRIMRECAGEDESAELGAASAGADFDDLGYDSLAVMETASRVSREYGVSLPEEEVADVRTPESFVAMVRQQQRQQQPV